MEETNGETLESTIALRDINLRIKHGEFVCVIGDVGSGKSSLLNAIIGDLLYLDNEFVEMNKDLDINDKIVSMAVKSYSNKKLTNAPIVLAESVAYVQQNPWI